MPNFALFWDESQSNWQSNWRHRAEILVMKNWRFSKLFCESWALQYLFKVCFQKSHFRVLLCTRQRVKRFQKVPKVNDHFLIDLNSWYFNRQQFRLYILMCQIFGCLALIKTGFIRVDKWHEFGVTKWPLGVTGVSGVTSVKIFKKVNFYKFLGPISFFL